MNIARLQLQGFMSYEQATVEFPRRGIVLVTGPNGSGKSSLVESVAVSLWGNTLRGSSPWTDDGKVVLETFEGLTVECARKRGTTNLIWKHEGDSPGPGAFHAGATATKAREALEHIIGSFDVWRRSAVFSSTDSSAFTLATDKERKLLLESILGLDRFDVALETCRQDYRKAQTEAERHERRLEGLRQELVGVQQRLNDAIRSLAGVPEPEDIGPEPPSSEVLAERQREIQGALRANTTEVASLNGRVHDANRNAAAKQAEIRTAEQQFARVNRGECPTCTQPITEATKAKLQAPVVIAREQAQEADAEAIRVEADLTAQISDLNDEADELRKAEATVKATRASAERDRGEWVKAKVRREAAAKERQRLDDIIAGGQMAAGRVEADLAEAATKAVVLAKAVEELGAVDQVLGLRGVRVQLLARALGGLELAANGWLARIAGDGLRLSIKPYVEKKTGGVSDAIGIEVEGAGGGKGYRGASGGERRRIDVALMLALGEVAAAAHGTTTGTLWFDEVFDALDAEGLGAVCRAVEELAQERCVVVISHRADLVDALGAATHLRLPFAPLA